MMLRQQFSLWYLFVVRLTSVVPRPMLPHRFCGLQFATGIVAVRAVAFFSFGTALACNPVRCGTNNVGFREIGAGLREEQGLD